MERTLDRKLFAQRLKECRKREFRTQEEFAKAIGKKIETIRNWEQGRTFPPTGEFIKICEILNCSADYLTGRYDYDLMYARKKRKQG